jgi:hypothetical protein
LPASFSRAVRLLALAAFAVTAAACSSPGGLSTPAPGSAPGVPSAAAGRSIGGHVKPFRCIVGPTNTCGGGGVAGPPTGSSYDVTNHHGTVLTSVQSKVIYFGYQPSWGDQTTFLKNLYASSFFAHLMAEYVPNHGAFTVASPAYYPAPTGYYDDQNFVKHEYYDISKIMGTVVSLAGKNVGPHYLYHIITPGDLPYCSTNGLTCLQSSCGDTGSCAQTECAEHDYGDVFITIQGDPGPCDVFTNLSTSPLSIVTAGQEQTLNSTVLHETMEAITDPYYGNPSPANPTSDFGWYGNGNEIADICEGFAANMDLNGYGYFVQPIWSNTDQKCYYIPHLYIWPPIALGAGHGTHPHR